MKRVRRERWLWRQCHHAGLSHRRELQLSDWRNPEWVGIEEEAQWSHSASEHATCQRDDRASLKKK